MTLYFSKNARTSWWARHTNAQQKIKTLELRIEALLDDLQLITKERDRLRAERDQARVWAVHNEGVAGEQAKRIGEALGKLGWMARECRTGNWIGASYLDFAAVIETLTIPEAVGEVPRGEVSLDELLSGADCD